MDIHRSNYAYSIPIKRIMDIQISGESWISEHRIIDIHKSIFYIKIKSNNIYGAVLLLFHIHDYLNLNFRIFTIYINITNKLDLWVFNIILLYFISTTDLWISLIRFWMI